MLRKRIKLGMNLSFSNINEISLDVIPKVLIEFGM
jgi:hypothetical protein